MQLKFLTTVSLLGALATAQNNIIITNNDHNNNGNNNDTEPGTIIIKDNMVDIINLFPECSLPCISDTMNIVRCRVGEFDCNCKWIWGIVESLRATCSKDQCAGVHNDIRARMYDMCHRWWENPPPEEIKAARILYRKRVVDYRDWIDKIRAPSARGQILADHGVAVTGAALGVVAAVAMFL
ncbi:hypothetical protein F4811DRAFT_557518 [Daldinia bambusicola]|nr:hypothetical protein F4811DRAFT_557518 [Daldinia bambusicola]